MSAITPAASRLVSTTIFHDPRNRHRRRLIHGLQTGLQAGRPGDCPVQHAGNDYVAAVHGTPGDDLLDVDLLPALAHGAPCACSVETVSHHGFGAERRVDHLRRSADEIGVLET